MSSARRLVARPSSPSASGSGAGASSGSASASGSGSGAGPASASGSGSAAGSAPAASGSASAAAGAAGRSASASATASPQDDCIIISPHASAARMEDYDGDDDDGGHRDRNRNHDDIHGEHHAAVPVAAAASNARPHASSGTVPASASSAVQPPPPATATARKLSSSSSRPPSLSKIRSLSSAIAVKTRRSGSYSSFSLPSRSFIHTASHGRNDMVTYASPAVRHQTEELARSFISDSEMPYFTLPGHNPHNNQSDYGTIDATLDDGATSGEDNASQENGRLLRHVSFAPDERPSKHPALRSKPGADVPEVVVTSVEGKYGSTETSPLLPPRDRLFAPRSQRRHAASDNLEAGLDSGMVVGRWNRVGHHYPSLRSFRDRARVLVNPKAWDMRYVAQKSIAEPVSMLPAVFLGVLLNLLDALSYGIILFPLGESAFADLGPDGVSMFYVSCIVSQLVYSTGSIFKGGIGSEMIEVVPFFHKMTYTIMATMGTENPDALRATVITSYAMSSILTGLVFFGLGCARLGTLVNFFPHSILTGCIGGVGIFLFVTGIEVSARLEGDFSISPEGIELLFAKDTVVLWILPLVLAIALLITKRFYDRPWLVPTFYVGITIIFYIVTTIVPSIDMATLRDAGWVFQAPRDDVPFYNYFSLYKFDLVDWNAIWLTVPSQLALTFFGILHVPINVPNLAMVVQEDNVSINRELIMHGISNTLSGCVGSVQNYLVFVNSVLFMNTGGNDRLAGFMLAGATFGLWVAGPVVIGYVPVMVVGTLIYMLGIDLAVEALISTYGRLHRLEYVTIIVIALVMGLFDFVVGIAIGIGLACLVYVVQTSRKTVIRAEFCGTVAESTVRRHPRHRTYLHKVGRQIRVVKLGGYLFFGSIVKVEKKVRALIDAETFAASPIRYLILDFSHVSGIDFSASEAFNRMNRILYRREVSMAVAGVRLDSEVGRSLQMVGLFVTGDDDPSIPAPKAFESLNNALEACENELLMVLTEKQRGEAEAEANRQHGSGSDSPPLPVPDAPMTPGISPFDLTVGSPRREMLHEEATVAMRRESIARAYSQHWSSHRAPLPLLMQTLQDLSPHDIDFWAPAARFFRQKTFAAGAVVYARGDRPDSFYLLESGVLRAEYLLEQGAYHERIVAGTTCGELPFFSDTERTCTVTAERECLTWQLDSHSWLELQLRHPRVATELLKVGMKLSAERMSAITSYVLITAS